MRKPLPFIKAAAACLLMISFFLPISSCSYTVPLELGMEGKGPGNGGGPAEERTVVFSPREYTDLSEAGSWLNLLGFFWPLLVLGFQAGFRGRRSRLLLPSAGVALSILTGAVVYTWASVGKPLIGAYLGAGAALVLLGVYLSELGREIKNLRSALDGFE